MHGRQHTEQEALKLKFAKCLDKGFKNLIANHGKPEFISFNKVNSSPSE
jgi:hypothetical protein